MERSKRSKKASPERRKNAVKLPKAISRNLRTSITNNELINNSDALQFGYLIFLCFVSFIVSVELFLAYT